MWRIAGFVVFALAVGAAHAQGDPIAGKEKTQACQACHGEEGRSESAQFPVLAGQYPDYLVQALQAYKTGARENAIMAPFAQQLSARDMQDIAAYYSTRPNGVYLKRIER